MNWGRCLWFPRLPEELELRHPALIVWNTEADGRGLWSPTLRQKRGEGWATLIGWKSRVRHPPPEPSPALLNFTDNRQDVGICFGLGGKGTEYAKGFSQNFESSGFEIDKIVMTRSYSTCRFMIHIALVPDCVHLIAPCGILHFKNAIWPQAFPRQGVLLCIVVTKRQDPISAYALKR